MRFIDITSDTRFWPDDFSNDNYIGVKVFNRKNDVPLILMMSRGDNPPHYLVADGLYKQMYYSKYSDAIDYCKRKGFIIEK